MGSPAIPGSANEHSLMDQRFDAMDERMGRMEARLDKLDERVDRLEMAVGQMAVAVARLDTKMNIILGILGAAGAGASFLLVRLLLG